jgi:UDP-3-O-[3-hydroxymyristoyl] N-acetylglucosamine deacetylase
MVHEKTIKKEVSFSGVGLHSGKPVAMKCSPAPPGTGVVFVRTDMGSVLIPVREAAVLSTFYSTTIGANGAQVQTVEHLLAAIAALSIDNLFIEIDGEEIPIADGSAAPFSDLLLEAGTYEQKREKQVIAVIEPFTIADGEKVIRVFPSESFEISYTIAYQHPLIASQQYTYRHSEAAFIREIAPARTFGFLKDIKHLLEKGYAKGGSLENAIVVGEDKILNPEELRFKDEFVRHKVLDLIGDIALLGMPIRARIEAYHAGHHVHTRLIETLRSSKNLSRTIPATLQEETFASLSV